MGADNTHDRRIGGVDMGICGTRARGSLRSGDVSSGFFLGDSGNAVLSAVMNIALATLTTLSVLTLVFTAYHGLVIQDAAITAASKAGRAESTDQQPYLLKMLRNSLPSLASFDGSISKSEKYVAVTVQAGLPGFGFLKPPTIEYSALASRETVE